LEWPPTMKVEARDREVPVAFVWAGRGVVGEDDGEGGAAEELMRWRVMMETGAGRRRRRGEKLFGVTSMEREEEGEARVDDGGKLFDAAAQSEGTRDICSAIIHN